MLSSWKKWISPRLITTYVESAHTEFTTGKNNYCDRGTICETTTPNKLQQQKTSVNGAGGHWECDVILRSAESAACQSYPDHVGRTLGIRTQWNSGLMEVALPHPGYWDEWKAMSGFPLCFSPCPRNKKKKWQIWKQWIHLIFPKHRSFPPWPDPPCNHYKIQNLY